MGAANLEVATIARHYLDRFKRSHGKSLTGDQWSALNAIMGCRTAQYGQLTLSCDACACQSTRFQSCGHRSCNRCQNHCTTRWLERQTIKLLPVEYFMVTFTLPCELRELAKGNPKVMYSLLFHCAVSTLKDFALNDKAFAAQLAMTAILHTHTRQLDYHPHVHLIGEVASMHSETSGKRSKRNTSSTAVSWPLSSEGECLQQ